MNHPISRRTLYLIALVISATASTPAQVQERAQGKPDAKMQDAAAANPSFEATALRSSYGINLDFRHAPEFVLTMESGGREEEKRLVGIRGAGKKPAINIGKAGEVFYFKKKEKRDYGGNKFLAYEYSDREGEEKGDRFDLIIWTEIEAVSPKNLAHMKIDRAPFCIVQMVNAAGVQAFPLNRKGAPPEEKFQASGPIRFKIDGKWGYRDPTGERVIIEPKYKECQRFSESMAAVKTETGWGYINKSGQIAIELKFDRAEPFQGGRAKVTLDGQSGTIDKKGNFQKNK